MNSSTFSLEAAVGLVCAVRAGRPLVHCLTNHVVKNFTANALLAAGAAPAMVEHPEEAAQFAPMADALLVNLGTLEAVQMEAIRAAIAAAVAAGKPWVLDPVAVGPLAVRTAFAREISLLRPAMIRGNASEILALAGAEGRGRGVDSGVASEAAWEAGQVLARRLGTVVLVTGETDYAVDATSVVAIRGGHELLTRVTGVGCAMGALAAAICAGAPGRTLDAAVATSALLKACGSAAALVAPRPGSFAVALLDAIDGFGMETAAGRVTITPVPEA
jgi:hydroxyethylthiazole kinase